MLPSDVANLCCHPLRVPGGLPLALKQPEIGGCDAGKDAV